MADRLERLRTLRDQLTTRLEVCESDRDFAALATRLTDVLAQVDLAEKAQPQSEGTALDEVNARRAAKAAKGSARASRG